MVLFSVHKRKVSAAWLLSARNNMMDQKYLRPFLLLNLQLKKSSLLQVITEVIAHLPANYIIVLSLLTLRRLRAGPTSALALLIATHVAFKLDNNGTKAADMALALAVDPRPTPSTQALRRWRHTSHPNPGNRQARTFP